MLNQSEYLVMITRYLNNPIDEDLLMKVREFRAESPENEAYFLEIERIYHLSSAAARLEGTDGKKAALKLQKIIKPNSLNNRRWIRNIAASFLIFALGAWLYIERTKTTFTVKTTAHHQIDSVKLIDGSMVILAENSELKYPDNFDSGREISLAKGQAFFKITKDPAHPFKVVMNKSNVLVLGTSFNIKMSQTKIDLGVITGRVMFTPYQDGATSILTAGQALSYDIQKKEFITKIAQNSDSWLTKELVFVDTPLEEVCEQLTVYYGITIQLESNKRKVKKLNATFKQQTLDQVLEVLNETYDIKINKENNQINLTTP